MTTEIRPMTIADYDAAYALWSETEGVSLGDDDTLERIALYLKRNSGLCFVATVDGDLVGTVLCGHEGRRGILRHLAVKRTVRRQGVARDLVNECLAALARQGIRKCNIFVLDDNPDGLRFWEHMGWYRLEDNYRTLQHLTDSRG
jgi:ribosomal protein S18 acetylase RimI-like enzyme